MEEHISEQITPLDAPTTPKRTRFQEFWLLFRENRLAIAGMCIFVLFFLTALVGLLLTSGNNPVLNPSISLALVILDVGHPWHGRTLNPYVPKRCRHWACIFSEPMIWDVMFSHG